MKNEREIAKVPTEGKWFEVNPLSIDKSLFEKEIFCSEYNQIRHLILEAFTELEKNPEKYGKCFKTMIPTKDWPSMKTVEELKEMASNVGDHMADLVEQSLEWAQRIANGESWKTICETHDTVKWMRLVSLENGAVRLIGGEYTSPTAINCIGKIGRSILEQVVPLVVDY